MTGKPVTDEQLGRISRKWHAIFEKIAKGALPLDKVLGAFQAIHDGRFVNEDALVVHQKPLLINGIFAPPEVQVENVRRWNDEQQGWGFSDENFASLAEAPEWPDGEEAKLVAVVLVPYLATVQQTFDELWQVAATQQPNSWRWAELHSDPDHLRLLSGIEHKPGLQWEVIDLGANWDRRDGISPESVRDPGTSPHAGCLAAAAHHPKWVQAMDGEKVPFIWLPAYEVTVTGRDPWQRSSRLSWDHGGRGVDLDAYWSDRRSYFAIPAFRE